MTPARAPPQPISLPNRLPLARPTARTGGPRCPYFPSVSRPAPASAAQAMDATGLLNLFAEWMTSLRWAEMKQYFELWIRSLDWNGKPNRPTVELYNYYLRANLMMGAPAGDMLDLVAKMEDFVIVPNTTSYNLVLKAMQLANQAEAALKLLKRLEVAGGGARADDESYDMVITMLFQQKQSIVALECVDKALKSGCSLSMEVFTQCARACLDGRKLDKLVAIIEKCKTMDQNKALSPSWNQCNYILDAATREDNSKLAFHALEFLARWIAKGEAARPFMQLAVDECLVVSALRTAARTYTSNLMDASWAVLRRSLRHKNPSPQCFIAKINAHAAFGNLEKAVAALREFESACEGYDEEAREEMFSPFTSLYPLAVACSRKGFETLDLVYLQLEKLSRAECPYKSVAALNCVILGCANIWDLVRAYETFEAIHSFGLSPDVHSYNCLMYAYGKLKGIAEADKVLNHMVSLGIKPNAKSYSLLVDAHLVVRDAKSALQVIDQMVSAGYVPSRETLKKVRRRCTREMDYESDVLVESFAKRFNIQMGTEASRDFLFTLDYSTSYG
ncbi:pentatricopeptide repeat-containing protein At1g26460, mitochondrial-like [Dipodomys spectabilis]|uniref:pentatricopeptide repeat-containing protein At1g26460, mitochondrial-like n=1 Tax=Dipodomys spectabilis TaxID=105255 RepID=UPI001C53439B|nr:pentatricopeptide repeat-containing protein At1g26460, mitochondrial-like [Dipodomys spectabilis]